VVHYFEEVLMKRNVLLVLAAVAVLAIGSAAIASNMGFKISIPLTAGYSNFVSLPYYNSYTTDNSMFSDIPACTSVSRWNNATTAWQNYSGGATSRFNITAGEAYVVKVSTSGNWIVVGSHNPGLALTLTTGYSNFVSVPYHTTATNDNALFSQITGCTSVSRWNNATTAWQNYSGGATSRFNITAGEGYVIKVSGTTSWTPAHY
jgi:hypothetical protein